MKQYFSIALIALLLLGCSGQKTNNPNANVYIGGNVGLNLYLQQGSPPPEVFDGGKYPFTVNVVVENNGEADIGPGTDNPYVSARVEGILPQNFGVTAADLHQTLNDKIEGAHKDAFGTITPGRVGNIIFPTPPANFNYQTKLQGNQVMTLRGTVCYDYSNEATTQLCFKKDILENAQDSTICTLTGPRVVANSGGPIHITDVTENPMSEGKIQVSFTVAHVGPGEFYGRDASEDCDPSVRNTNKYKVGVELKLDDPTAVVNCGRLGGTGTGDLTLYGGTPTIVTCTIASSAQDRIHTSVLDIKTTYRYGQFIEQPIVIKSLPN